MSKEVKVLFLGTSACDFAESLKNEHKNVFDKNARRSSSLLINGTTLIDCGFHTYNSLVISKSDISKIDDIVITHTHDDHFYIETLEKIISCNEGKTINLWVRDDAKIPEIKNINVKRMELFKRYEIKDELFVTGMRANHNQRTYPQHLLFEAGEKKLFYGCDGAWMIMDTYYALHNMKLDMMVLDGTVGNIEGDYRIFEHNSIPMIKIMVPSFKKFGIIDEKSNVYISHIAPSLHKEHSEIENELKDVGVKVAFDGLEVTL